MRYDAHGLEILERQACLDLLGTVPLGRVVFTDRALPAIQPVNFVLDRDQVILRAAPGSKLAIAVRGAVVAFEADDFDPVGHSGWSVTVIGRSRVVDEPAETARLAKLPLRPWTPGPRDHFVAISAGHVSGRRIHPAGQVPAA